MTNFCFKENNLLNTMVLLSNTYSPNFKINVKNADYEFDVCFCFILGYS